MILPTRFIVRINYLINPCFMSDKQLGVSKLKKLQLLLLSCMHRGDCQHCTCLQSQFQACTELVKALSTSLHRLLNTSLNNLRLSTSCCRPSSTLPNMQISQTAHRCDQCRLEDLRIRHCATRHRSSLWRSVEISKRVNRAVSATQRRQAHLRVVQDLASCACVHASTI